LTKKKFSGACGRQLWKHACDGDTVTQYLPSNNGGIGLGNTIGTLTLPPADPPAAFGTAI
jgi:hypothetical protein